MEDNQLYVTNQGGSYSSSPKGNKDDGEDKGSKYFWVGLLSGLIIAILTTGSVYVATRMQYNALVKKLQAENGYVVVEQPSKKPTADKNTTDKNTAGTANNGSEASEMSDEAVKKLKLIESTIRKNYYRDEDISQEAMDEAAYRAVVDSLGDPYSVYYSEEELNALYQDTMGIYYGIGAYVSIDEDTGYGKISSVISGTPAEEADLHGGDLIYLVDGVNVKGMTLNEIVSKVKGEEHTKVHLTLIRDGEQIEKDVERRRVEAPTVKFEMLSDDIAYIQITEFDTITVSQFTEAYEMARGNGMKGLVLDLRDNPGGSLATVVSIGRKLLPEGMIVYTEDKYGKRSEYKSDGKEQIQVPMVVLVNGNSASASEILAGAIKDYGVGYLMGTTTYGKGIVQKPIELSDGSAIKLTISSYYTPKGVNIHGIGIEPDEVVEFDSDLYYSDEKIDNQLERAKEYLNQKMK